MSLPTEGELYEQLSSHLRKAQEITASLSHLTGLNNRVRISENWFQVSEHLKRLNHTVNMVAAGKMS